MSDPDAKDYKWLVARERGDDIGHVLAAERAPYEKLGALIGSGMAPSAGWRQRVLDAIEAEEPQLEKPPAEEPPPHVEVTPEPAPARPPVPVLAPAPLPAPELEVAGEVEHPPVAPVVPIDRKPQAQKPRRLPWIVGGITASAAAAAALLYVIPGSPAPPPSEANVIALETKVHRAPTVLRADPTHVDQANVGDTLVVQAEVIGPAEIRVYGGSGERLIAQCNDRGGCTVERDGERRRFSLEVPLTAPGTVRAVVFVGADLPRSAGSLAPDLDAAVSAKRPHQMRAPTRVL